MDALSIVGKAIAQTFVEFGFSAQIRTEIEREVEELLGEFHKAVRYGVSNGELLYDEEVEPDYVEIGDIRNTHRGYNLYSNGDTILGIPVRISRTRSFSIALVAESVKYIQEKVDDDGYLVGKTKQRVEDIVVQSSW